MSEKKTGLALLREPFKENQIGKMPKPTKKQTEEVKADFKKGVRCKLCSAWHHPDVVHLDYVGHAALTDRLLDADPKWTWEPMAIDEHGLPRFDKNGGLWIKLTVDGHTRLGYGNANASAKDAGAREKEVIGDALRNAAMRFGAALDLWHKGDLHADDDDKTEVPAKVVAPIRVSGSPTNFGPDVKNELLPVYPEKSATIPPKTQVADHMNQLNKNVAQVKSMPINGQMFQNLIMRVKEIEAGWQKVEAYTKTHFGTKPNHINMQQYEQIMSIITAGAL